jgi:hypothetical protein
MLLESCSEVQSLTINPF